MVFRRFYKNKEFSVVFPPRWAHPLFSEQSASMKYELTPCTWMQTVTNKASWSNRKIFSSVFQLIPGKVSNPMGADLRKVIISVQQPSCLFQISPTAMSSASNPPRSTANSQILRFVESCCRAWPIDLASVFCSVRPRKLFHSLLHTCFLPLSWLHLGGWAQETFS